MGLTTNYVHFSLSDVVKRKSLWEFVGYDETDSFRGIDSFDRYLERSREAPSPGFKQVTV